MKRLLCIVFILLLLAGCGENTPESTVPESTAQETTVPVTEPPVPWVEALGSPWDAEGALVELPLTVPNGLRYVSYMIFDGDLLLWSMDNHRLDYPQVELCLIDLDTGTVFAQEDVEISAAMGPQALMDKLYLVDRNTGEILELDKNLSVINSWETDIRESSVYLSAGNMAYVDKWGEESYRLDLDTGERKPILEGDPEISYLSGQGSCLAVTYYHPDSGREMEAFIDLRTGEELNPPDQARDVRGSYRDGIWLMDAFQDSFHYTLYAPDQGPVAVNTDYKTLKLIAGDRLLMTGEGSNWISLHDLTGKALAKCTLSEMEYGYNSIDVVYHEEFDGYFVILSDHDGTLRLLFWDTHVGSTGDDIPFEPLPEPSELESQVLAQVSQLEIQYGINILVGDRIGSYFYDFSAEVITDWSKIQDALDTLENALEDYPEGFFRQLRYGDIQRTEIHLAGVLTPTNEEYVDTYSAFVQDSYDRHVMVVDIHQAGVETYYHEFSHIIDSFLEWDAMNREGSLFNEETWCGLNPGWFPGYTYSYSWEQYVEDYSCFVDSYSTINPTEDRARVLEYAMTVYGGYNFEEDTVLLKKLSYYCRCIRDAFDTSGWPDTVLWEQYLK